MLSFFILSLSSACSKVDVIATPLHFGCVRSFFEELQLMQIRAATGLRSGSAGSQLEGSNPPTDQISWHLPKTTGFSLE
jgi:hypothetical protein